MKLYQKYFKRLIDIIISLCILPFVIFEVILIGPIIYFTDKGSIFYNGKRVGKDGRIFKMFKLRSMYNNSKDIRNKDGSTYNNDYDPRVTPIGRIIRKTSLDEFPQFLNVLIGDMSLIGPRPSLTTTPYEKYNVVRKKRVTVRPGVTGYSQAYFRNSITQAEKFEHDCEYVDSISFKNDLNIFFKTIKSVLRKDNIYIESK